MDDENVEYTASEIFFQVLLSFYAYLFLLSMIPFRHLGFFGTLEKPKLFKKGDKVPQYLYVHFISSKMIFIEDTEVYFDKEFFRQVYRPQHKQADKLIVVSMGDVHWLVNLGWRHLFWGAPCTFIDKPREKT